MRSLGLRLSACILLSGVAIATPVAQRSVPPESGPLLSEATASLPIEEVSGEATDPDPTRSCQRSSLQKGCAPVAIAKAPTSRRLAQSRVPFALSALPPETPVCNEPPAWTIGLRPTIFQPPNLARIEPFLRFFAENPDGRKITATWLHRSGRHRAVVERALRREGLPRDVVALVFVESGFLPTAKSKAGAVGLWQLMETTATNAGLVVRPDFDERRSVLRSSEAATHHLSDLFARFGSWELAFAAYDAGARLVEHRMNQFGAPDYWSLSAIPGALPQETVDYVPKVVAFATLLRNLDRFGFDDVNIERPLFTTELEVPGGTTFATLARAAGTSIAHIREMNPEIVGGEKVPGGLFTTYANVPAGGVARAKVVLPYLLGGHGGGLEDVVGESFDWSRDDLDKALAAVGHDAKVATQKPQGIGPLLAFASKPSSAKEPAHPAKHVVPAKTALAKPAPAKPVLVKTAPIKIVLAKTAPAVAKAAPAKSAPDAAAKPVAKPSGSQPGPLGAATQTRKPHAHPKVADVTLGNAGKARPTQQKPPASPSKKHPPKKNPQAS